MSFSSPCLSPSPCFIIHSFLTGGGWSKLCNFWASFTPLPSTSHPISLFQLLSSPFLKVSWPPLFLYLRTFPLSFILLCCVYSHPFIPDIPPTFSPLLDVIFPRCVKWRFGLPTGWGRGRNEEGTNSWARTQTSFMLSWKGDRIWQDLGSKREGQGCGFGRRERWSSWVVEKGGWDRGEDRGGKQEKMQHKREGK